MSIKVPIVVDYFGSKGIKRAIKEFNSLKSTGEKTAFVIKKAFKGIAFAAAGFAAALAGAAVAGWNLAKAAAEDQVSAQLLAKQLRKTTKATDDQVSSVEDWIGKLQLASGVADSDLRPNLSKLVRATKSVGKAQKLLTLALDVSAGSGRDLDSVVTSLVRAYGGNLQGLTRMGISLDKSIIKSKDFKKAQEELQKQFGGANAQRAATFQGTMDRLNQAFGELKEKAGYALLKPLQKLADLGVKMTDAFGEKGAAGALAVLRDGFATLFWNDQGQLSAAGQALNHLIDLLNKLAAAGIIAASAAGGALIGNIVPGVGPIVGAFSGLAGGYAATQLMDTRVANPLGQFNAQRFQQGLLATTVNGPGASNTTAISTGGLGPRGAGITVNVYNGDPKEVVRAIRNYQNMNGRVPMRILNLGS